MQRLHTGHEIFDKHYSVYTTDVQEASLILSYHMLDHIVVIGKKLDREIVFSFVAGKCYIAVPFEENLEPPKKDCVTKKRSSNISLPSCWYIQYHQLAGTAAVGLNPKLHDRFENCALFLGQSTYCDHGYSQQQQPADESKTNAESEPGNNLSQEEIFHGGL